MVCSLCQCFSSLCDLLDTLGTWRLVFVGCHFLHAIQISLFYFYFWNILNWLSFWNIYIFLLSISIILRLIDSSWCSPSKELCPDRFSALSNDLINHTEEHQLRFKNFFWSGKGLFSNVCFSFARIWINWPPDRVTLLRCGFIKYFESRCCGVALLIFTGFHVAFSRSFLHADWHWAAGNTRIKKYKKWQTFCVLWKIFALATVSKCIGFEERV